MIARTEKNEKALSGRIQYRKKELLKLRRESTQAGFQKRRENIKEEIADVQIMLDQMRIVFGDTSEQEEFKVNRLRERLEREIR